MSLLSLVLTFWILQNVHAKAALTNPTGFSNIEGLGNSNLFVWSDTCNVYVVREGEAALLIDLGDGSVMDHLGEIGVKRVEWILFTHHHREQCQGVNRLQGSGVKMAAPEAERVLFESPLSFRKMKVSLGDKYTIHGSSYVRPPICPIPLAKTFVTNDVFVWRGHEIQCMDTRGNSPGSMSYLLKHNGRWLAFSGDIMLADARMHTWFDTEWDYGFGAGIQALRKTVGRLRLLDLKWMLPSHGKSIREPQLQLSKYEDKLSRLEKLYLRGYGVEGASVEYQDKVSKPTTVMDVAQVTPHLFKFKRRNFWPNFGLILADSGHGLVVDCGLTDQKFLDDSLDGLRKHYGLKAIDAIVITHMHGDHFLDAPYLREKWGAKIWALDRMADVCEHPERFDYAAPIQAYGKKGVEGVRFDRLFHDGETFQWENYKFTIDWMPGQTEFALCMHGMIDGRKVAFTGDNIFGDPEDILQTGHEAVVAHNSAILEEGYIYGAEYLRRLQPDIMVGGHSFVMDRPMAFIERFRKWSYEMRDAFQALSSDEDYRYGFDPFWVRAEPYRLKLTSTNSTSTYLNLRNFGDRAQTYQITVQCPDGISVEPGIIQQAIPPNSTVRVPISIRMTKDLPGKVYILGFDMTVSGKRRGALFDAIVGIE